MPVPNFSAGEILTASAMNAAGLWRITTATVSSTGGTAATASNGVITIGAGNTSVVVSNAFSTNFKNYKIIISGGTASTFTDLNMTLGSTNTGYYWGVAAVSYVNGAVAGTGSNNTSNAYWRAGNTSTDGVVSNIDIFQPYEAVKTFYNCISSFAVTTYGSSTISGYLNNSTSYTGFTIVPNSGTISGGTIRIYGYRD